MFTPHGDNRVFEFDQSGAGTFKLTDGDVSNSWQHWETRVFKLHQLEAVYFKS
jgi:hypothetical protein